jgi:hypothetical protein
VILDLAKSVRIESEIARRGGLNLKRFGSELVGPCPRCSGRDRFGISITKQVFNCRGCGATGDVIALVQHVDGVDFKTAVRTLGGFEVGQKWEIPKIDHRPIERAKPDDAKNTERSLKLWDAATPITGTPAQVYLHGRGLHDIPGDGVIRFHPACPFGDTRAACMVTLFRDIVTDEPKAIHRIAIDPGGIKIGKMMLGPVSGCAVKLDADENVEFGLHIAEGIETAIAARMMGYRPCWALGSSGAMRGFPLLNGVESLTLMVDHDEADQRGRRAGQDAASECWRRWKDAGREVRAFTTNNPGTDIADAITEASCG